MNADFVRVKKLFFDKATVMSAADRATVRELSKFGAHVRRRVKSSIKPAPKREATARKRGLIGEAGRYVSSPGSPPLSHVGTLRDSIYFASDPGARSVVIGPIAFRGSGRGAKALEESGESERRGKPIFIRPRPFMKPAFVAELPSVPAQFRGTVK